ncbi:MAG: MFS transporter [Acidobacteriaceae bacterium]|nr:MFS transporter [Acidobacteriaceae bacterium]
MDTPAVLNHHPSRLQKNSLESGRRALVLLTACCGVFAGFGSAFVFTFGVFLKPLSAAFGWSRAEVSLGFTVAALTVAVCSPFIGRLLDRYPARRIILPCVMIYGIGFGSLSLLTPHIGHFLAVLVLLGIVGNGTTQLGYARVVSAWFDASRGRALAAVMAGSGTGSMVFPPLAQALISAYGWRSAYAILGGIILALGVPLVAVFLYEPSGQKQTVKASAAKEMGGVWPCVRSLPFILLTSGLLLFSVATNGLNAHLPPLLTDRGFSAEHAAAVLSVLGFSALASKLSTGYLLDRFFAARVAMFLFVVCAAGFLLIIYGQGTIMAYAGAALIGAGMGAESDAVPYLLTRYFGLRRFSELYGYTWSAYACAGALGPLVMGGMFDKTGSYRSTLLVFCGIVLVAAALFGLLPRYKTNSTKVCRQSSTVASANGAG